MAYLESGRDGYSIAVGLRSNQEEALTVGGLDQAVTNTAKPKDFPEQEDQFITGEVSPTEQDKDSDSGGAELVVDHLSDPPSEESSKSSQSGSQVTEENHTTADQSELVPSSGFNGNEGLQMVKSKDWNQIKDVQDSHSQKLSSLEEKMSQMEVKFDQQIQAKDAELQSKQEELNKTQRELDDCKKQVQELQEKLAQETSARREAEQERSDLVQERSDLQGKLEEYAEKIRKKEIKISELEKEIQHLKKHLENAEKANHTGEAVEDLKAKIDSQTDLLQQMRQEQSSLLTVPPDHTSSLPSPADSQDSQTLEFSPNASINTGRPPWATDREQDSDN